MATPTMSTSSQPAQAKKLYDHLRTEDGRVPVVALSNALGELMESFRAGKNSSSSPA